MRKKQCTKKYISNCLACFLLFSFGHLSSRASCPVRRGGNSESYNELSNFFFPFAETGVSVLFSCERERESRAFTSLLFPVFPRLRLQRSGGRPVFAAHAISASSTVRLSSVYIHSKLYMLVFILFYFFFK